MSEGRRWLPSLALHLPRAAALMSREADPRPLAPASER